MHIIVKKSASHALFRPHYNSSMGKMYHTRDEYMGDIKKYGLEPYRELPEKKSQPLTLSREQREMCREAAKHDKAGTTPGGRFQKAFAELSVAKKPKWISDAEVLTNRGGFKSDEE